MRAIILLFFLSLLTSSAAAPQIAWTARYGFGTNSDSKVFALALDQQQNLIVAGTSKNELGNDDYVTAKYNAAGSNLWIRRFDSGAVDTARGLAIDGEASVVITGTSSTVKYGPDGTEQWNVPYGGRGVTADGSNNVVVTGFSEEDFATVKLTPQGSNMWVRFHDRIGKPDIAKAVTVDQSGNVYVAGTETWISDRLYCCYSTFYVLKYDAEGNQAWIQGIDEGMAFRKESEVKGLLVQPDGNVFFTGNGLGPVSRIFYTGMFTNTGQKVWANSMPAFSGGVMSMTVDAQGNVLTTGGAKPFGEVYITFKTLKLANDGQTLWAKEYAGPEENFARANAIALDSADNVYVTGQSTGPGTASDWATIKYSSSGQEQWVVRYDGPVHGEDQATAIAVNNTGAIYAGGFTTTTNGIEMLVIKYVEVQSIQVQTNQCVLLQFLGTPGQNYRFQSTTNFADWDDIGAAIADLLGLYQWLDTNPPVVPHKFYRTVSP